MKRERPQMNEMNEKLHGACKQTIHRLNQPPLYACCNSTVPVSRYILCVSQRIYHDKLELEFKIPKIRRNPKTRI